MYRDFDKKLSEISYYHNRKKIWREFITYNKLNLVYSRHVVIEGSDRENFEFNEKYKLDATPTAQFERDEYGRVIKIENVPLAWEGEDLHRVNLPDKDVVNFYGVSGTLKMSCHLDDCFKIIDKDTIYYQGSLIKKINLQGRPIAVFIDDTVYPVVADHLGSIIGVLTAKGDRFIFRRKFGPWGEKTVKYFTNGEASDSDQENELKDAALLEKQVAWSYAGLIENPLLSGTEIELYWSKSRVYSPGIKAWLSADPVLRWNPNALLSKPGNWRPFEYASGNPVNFVDPSGFCAGCGPDFAKIDRDRITELESGKMMDHPFKENELIFRNGNSIFGREFTTWDGIKPGADILGDVLIGAGAGSALKSSILEVRLLKKTKGVEVIFSKDFRAGIHKFTLKRGVYKGKTLYRPHFHKRPGIGRHRPWE